LQGRADEDDRQTAGKAEQQNDEHPPLQVDSERLGD